MRLVVQAALACSSSTPTSALVERLLENLIGNALKHTPAGGCITLAVAAEGTQLVTEVRDSGRSIAAADLPHVFDRLPRQPRRWPAALARLEIARGASSSCNGGTIGVASTPGRRQLFPLSRWGRQPF